jgi:hypothetical protein
MEGITEQLDVFENVITCDEMSIFQYHPETKKQSMHWKTPSSSRIKKGRMSKSKVKRMMIVFFNIRGVIMIQWVPEGQTFIQKYYLEVLTKFREGVRTERPELWKEKSWILHQDNAPAHKALAVRQFLAEKYIQVLEHPTPIHRI